MNIFLKIIELLLLFFNSKITKANVETSNKKEVADAISEAIKNRDVGRVTVIIDKLRNTKKQ
jgi:hypothetical protein